MNRFLEQNEAVLDTETGLIWPRNASLSDFSMRWNEALSFVKELNHSKLYGYSDWKLPNRKELFSLMSHETINPSLPADHPFTNIFTGYYWTSTTCSRLPNQAWYIHLGGARVFKGMKYNSYMTWPVRLPNPPDTKLLKTGQKDCYSEHGGITNCCDTGQDGEFQSGLPFNSPRFTEHDNFLYDNATGLTWFKNANFHHKMSDWKSALDLIETINRECKFGYDDWRMPTIRELENLTDMSRYSPALPADHLFVNVKEFYWSSTTSMYDTHYAWVLYMTDGAVGVGYKPLAEFYLWPVRGK